MRLTIDLRLSTASSSSAPHERVITLAELVALIREPRALRGALRSVRYERVGFLHDAIPFSGLQAGAVLLAGAARSAAFEHPAGATSRRPLFVARAAPGFLAAVAAELLHSAGERRRAGRIGAHSFGPRAGAGAVRRVAYLRTEPTLRYLGEQVGGAATHTAGVVNGLVAGGAQVHVYAPERPAALREDARFTTVAVRRVFHFVHWFTLTAYSREFVAAGAGRPADIVYQRYAAGSYAGLALAERLGVPLVLEFNGSEIWVTRHWGSRGYRFERVLARLERRNLTDAALVVVASDVLREQLVEGGIDARRVLVNPNGVDVDGLAHVRDHEPTEWRRRLGRPTQRTVGFIGTFGLWHGVTQLPAIIQAVAHAAADVRWVLIGDGPLAGELAADLERRGLTAHVELTGVVPHEQAVELLGGCDVCVSPHVPNPDGSRFFGSPTKIFEYMGLAKPIVASDLEQIGQVLEHERSALLCPPGDPEAIAAGVLRLLADPALAGALGAAALADAAERYSWDAHARRILDAVAQLDAGTGAAP